MACPNTYCATHLPTGAKGCPSCGLPLPGGRYLGRFEIMGIRQSGPPMFTYHAIDSETGSPVELRVLVSPDQKAKKAFQQEAKALAKVAASGLQRVREVLSEGLPAAVLDPVSDRSSADLTPMAEKALLTVGLQVARSLKAAHAAGVLHRAIKPNHLRIDLKLGTTLVGWGWERLPALQSDADPARERTGDQDYLAPEVLNRKAVAQSDLYALGMTLIHLATGQDLSQLYDAESRLYHWQGYAELSPELTKILEDLTKSKLGDRLPTADRLIERLEELLSDESPEPEEAEEVEAAEALKSGRQRRRRVALPLHAYRDVAWPLALLLFLFPMSPVGEAPLSPRHHAAAKQGRHAAKPRHGLKMQLTRARKPNVDQAIPATPSTLVAQAPARSQFASHPPKLLGNQAAPGEAARPPGAGDQGTPGRNKPGAGQELGGTVTGKYLYKAGNGQSAKAGERHGNKMPSGVTGEAAMSTWNAPHPQEGQDAMEIHVSKSLHRLDIYRNSMLVMAFPVGLGANSSTPVGSFDVVSRAERPDYRAPDGHIVPGGLTSNPLGSRWVGLAVKGRSGIGIHGTNAPDSIGDDKSLGCIRMRNEDVERLYQQIGQLAKVIIEP